MLAKSTGVQSSLVGARSPPPPKRLPSQRGLAPADPRGELPLRGGFEERERPQPPRPTEARHQSLECRPPHLFPPRSLCGDSSALPDGTGVRRQKMPIRGRSKSGKRNRGCGSATYANDNTSLRGKLQGKARAQASWLERQLVWDHHGLRLSGNRGWRPDPKEQNPPRTGRSHSGKSIVSPPLTPGRRALAHAPLGRVRVAALPSPAELHEDGDHDLARRRWGLEPGCRPGG